MAHEVPRALSRSPPRCSVADRLLGATARSEAVEDRWPDVLVSHTVWAMRAWAHDRWLFPLRVGHPYPVSKHRLLRERLLQTGVCQPEDLLEAEPLRWSALTRVQDDGLLGRIRRGQMSVREQRGLGLPWSPELVERSRRVSHGTVLASREALRSGVAINLGGGSHHAGRDFARGYCLFNDIALACDALRADDLARRALVVDCDVHQGDGTAQLLAADPDAFTLSLHGARNYPFRRIPSDLDIDVPAGTTDLAYLTALDDALASALRADDFDIAFYLAGADPWRATGSDRSRSPSPAYAAATLWCSTSCAASESRSASCSPVATRLTSRTSWISTLPPPRRSPREPLTPSADRDPRHPECPSGGSPAERCGLRSPSGRLGTGACAPGRRPRRSTAGG